MPTIVTQTCDRLLLVWDQFHNNLLESQHFPCHHYLLEPLTNMTIFFDKEPTQTGPLRKMNDELRWKRGQLLSTGRILGLSEVWESFHNTLIASQHLPCLHHLLEPLTNLPVSDHKPNLTGPLGNKEWWVDVKARATIANQAWLRLARCMGGRFTTSS